MSSAFDGDDAAYAREIAAEEEAVYKGLFQPMRQWYNGDSASLCLLRGKYGGFPSFWQDMAKWANIRIVKKLYLGMSDLRDKGGDIDVMAMEAKLTSRTDVAVAVAEDANDGDGGGEQKKRKKSRWGKGPEDDKAETPASSSSFSSLCLPVDVGVIDPSKPSSNYSSSSSILRGAGKARTRQTTKWSSVDLITAAFSAGSDGEQTHLSPEALQQSLILQIQLKHVSDRLASLSDDIKELEANPSRPRSPSPPPQYDQNGKRTNTREVRRKESLNKERMRVIDEMVKVNPNFKPGIDLARTKPTTKVYIPIKQFPNYNFIGLIIGPRGNTQKKLEAETGCKISIRGKGSIKDGSRSSNTSQNDDELHVLVTGDTEEAVMQTAKKVEELLRPMQDEDNAHKQAQLRELAIIHGTLRDDDFCPFCGEKGHRQFECPHRKKSFQSTGIKCAICGDGSHPTRDCPMRGEADADKNGLDSEYNDFIDQLTGGSPRNVGNDGGSFENSAASSSSSRAPTGVGLGGEGTSAGEREGATIPVPKKQQTVFVASLMTGTAAPMSVLTVATGQESLAASSEMSATTAPPAPIPVPLATVQPTAQFPSHAYTQSAQLPQEQEQQQQQQQQHQGYDVAAWEQYIRECNEYYQKHPEAYAAFYQQQQQQLLQQQQQQHYHQQMYHQHQHQQFQQPPPPPEP